MNLPPPSTGLPKPRLRVFLFATVALIVLVAAIRASVCWRNASYMYPSNGVWLALAADLKDGAFYRPLFGPSGYGGTRYFPLYFILHTLLLKMGLPILLSGYLLSAAAIALLIVGTFYLTRELGAEPWLAACSAGAVLAAGSVQLSLLSVYDDALASALNVWGIAAIAHPRPNHSRVLLASILFSLAWSTKVTTVFGFAAAFIWLLSSGFSRTAWELAAETAGGYLAVVGAMVFASHGRIMGIFKACASAGTTPARAALGPFHMLSIVARDDPGLLLFLFLAVCVLPAKSLRSLPSVFFIVTAAVTAAIFGSPGTSWNHLLDLQLAAVVLFTVWLADKGAPLLKEAGTYALALATLLAAIPAVHRLEAEDRTSPAHRFERAIAFIGSTHKPILAENPALPVLAGQRPYVIDPFMLRLLRERIAGFGDPLLEGLRNQAFSAVVLSARDPRTDAGKAWYETDIFGPGFLAALSKNYRLASVLDGQFIYLPGIDAARSTVQAGSAVRHDSFAQELQPGFPASSLTDGVRGMHWAAEF